MNKITYIKNTQKKVFNLIKRKFKQYYLTGGTALAFYFNHRFSEDLDFFTQNYKKSDHDDIMRYIKSETGFSFILESEQSDPKFIPMKIYSLNIKKGRVLKIDFVEDYLKNIKPIRNGAHSIEDIYLRKLYAGIGTTPKRSRTGMRLFAGRQAPKDVFDIFYLSQNYKSVSDFFIEYFSISKAEAFIAWYRSFNRMNLKLELSDVTPKTDPAKVIIHLDNEILKALPDKIGI